MRSMMTSSSAGLTPAAGSSSRITSGSAISTRASSSSLRWPPDSTRAGSCASARQGDEVEQCRAPSRPPPALPPRRGPAAGNWPDAARRPGPARRSARSRAPSSRRRAAGSGRCGRAPCAMRRSGGSARHVAGRRCRSCPAVGCRLPASRLNSVVLPAPFGPISPSISPRRSASDMPSTAAQAAEPHDQAARLDQRQAASLSAACWRSWLSSCVSLMFDQRYLH